MHVLYRSSGTLLSDTSWEILARNQADKYTSVLYERNMRILIFIFAGFRLGFIQVKLLLAHIVHKYRILPTDRLPARLTYDKKALLCVPYEQIFVRLEPINWCSSTLILQYYVLQFYFYAQNVLDKGFIRLCINNF